MKKGLLRIQPGSDEEAAFVWTEADGMQSLQVLLEAGKVTLQVGGRLKLAHTFDGPLEASDLGLLTLRGSARFDDFSVRETGPS